LWLRHAGRVCGQFGAVVALACASGCVALPGRALRQAAPVEPRDTDAFATARQTVRGAFPPNYRATHRAIITVHQRQFVCDGLLTVFPVEGWHLAVISTLGLVTDLRVRGDGSAEVLKVTPLFREAWAREYVTQELRWLFTPPLELAPMGRLSDGRLVLEAESRVDAVKARYVCSVDGRRWEELEVVSGSRRLFHAKISDYGSFRGWPRAVPTEIEVDAGTHQLHLRMAMADAGAVAPEKEAR
jgi:hypothetical protein